MKTTLIHIIIGLFSFSAFGQSNEARLLKHAYEKRDIESLNVFFSNWEKEYQPNSKCQIENFSDTINDIYSIFKDFYTPLNLKRIGSSEWGDSIYADVDYVIVQNRIDYSIVKSLNKKEVILNYIKEKVPDTNATMYEGLKQALLKDTINYTLGFTYYDALELIYEDSIMDFRPNLNFGDVGALFYKPKYTHAITQFLKDNHHKPGAGGIMNPARAKGKSKARLEWINTKIKVFHGHWGGYWQLTTYPRVNRIIFDKEMQTAILFFRVVYQGGEALYKKIDNKWTLIDSKLTWIE